MHLIATVWLPHAPLRPPTRNGTNPHWRFE
jgi:hypothetical protein